MGCGSSTTGKSPTPVSKATPPVDLDVDLTDPAVERAATKIQATFRGHKTRRELRQEGVDTSDGPSPDDVQY